MCYLLFSPVIVSYMLTSSVLWGQGPCLALLWLSAQFCTQEAHHKQSWLTWKNEASGWQQRQNKGTLSGLEVTRRVWSDWCLLLGHTGDLAFSVMSRTDEVQLKSECMIIFLAGNVRAKQGILQEAQGSPSRLKYTEWQACRRAMPDPLLAAAPGPPQGFLCPAEFWPLSSADSRLLTLDRCEWCLWPCSRYEPAATQPRCYWKIPTLQRCPSLDPLLLPTLPSHTKQGPSLRAMVYIL